MAVLRDDGIDVMLELVPVLWEPPGGLDRRFQQRDTPKRYKQQRLA